MKRWQQATSPLQIHLDALKNEATSLMSPRGGTQKMYGEGMMSERVYKDNMYALNETRETLANKPTVPLEKLIDGVIKLVEDLDFSNKKQIIQRVVTKVIATKKEVTVWGHVPVLATQQVGLNVKHRYRWLAQRWQVYIV